MHVGIQVELSEVPAKRRLRKSWSLQGSFTFRAKDGGSWPREGGSPVDSLGTPSRTRYRELAPHARRKVTSAASWDLSGGDVNVTLSLQIRSTYIVIRSSVKQTSQLCQRPECLRSIEFVRDDQAQFAGRGLHTLWHCTFLGATASSVPGSYSLQNLHELRVRCRCGFLPVSTQGISGMDIAGPGYGTAYTLKTYQIYLGSDDEA